MSKYLDGLKNVNALLALTDGLRDLGAGLKEAFDLEKDIKRLEAERTEQRILLQQLQGQIFAKQTEAQALLNAANDEAARRRAAADVEIASRATDANLVMERAREQLKSTELQIEAAKNTASHKIEEAEVVAAGIIVRANAEAEALAVKLREQEMALAVREKRLADAVKTVGAV